MHCYSQFRPLWHYSAGDTCLYTWWLALFKTPHLTPAPRSKCSRCSTVTGWFRESHSALGSISLATAADNYIYFKNLSKVWKYRTFDFLAEQNLLERQKRRLEQQRKQRGGEKSHHDVAKSHPQLQPNIFIVQNEWFLGALEVLQWGEENTFAIIFHGP